MFRSARLLKTASRLAVARPQTRAGRRRPAYFRLRSEPLEDRRMLATVTVDTELDVVAGVDGLTSLREAIAVVNAIPGADDIVFDFGHDGPAVILLELGELAISDAVTITGDGPALLTIDAGDGSDDMPGTFDGFRIFNIDDGNAGNQIDVEISGLTLTGGDTPDNGGAILNRENLSVTGSTLSGNSSDDPGGGIYNHDYGTMTVTGSTLSDNSVDGLGGAIFNRGTVTVTSSTLSGNSASVGGGIYNRGTATVVSSTLSGNSANARGGAVYNLTYTTATIINSILSDNSAGAYGGAISNGGTVTVISSTLSGNSVNTWGGGIFNNRGTVTVTSSTLSGNSSGSYGGGIYNRFAMATITSSTLSGNSAGTSGGGIYDSGTTVVTSSLVAGNIAPSSPDFDGTTSGTYNLIGDGTGMTGLVDDSGGNQIGSGASPIDPLLGPLADNGGPTETHALLPGSPAFDAGDPSFTTPPDYDQRGTDYERVHGAAIDIGAYELLPADGNLNGAVDGVDYIIWAMHFGDDPALDPPGSPENGDYNNDGVVDGVDYVIWALNFGAGVSAAATVASLDSQTSTPSGEQLSARDSALDGDYDTGAMVADEPAVRQWQLSRAIDSLLKKARDRRGDRA